MKPKRILHFGTAALAVALASPVLIRAQNTATPIQHVVVIFDENNSFDHYFGRTRMQPIQLVSRSLSPCQTRHRWPIASH